MNMTLILHPLVFNQTSQSFGVELVAESALRCHTGITKGKIFKSGNISPVEAIRSLHSSLNEGQQEEILQNAILQQACAKASGPELLSAPSAPGEWDAMSSESEIILRLEWMFYNWLIVLPPQKCLHLTSVWSKALKNGAGFYQVSFLEVKASWAASPSRFSSYVVHKTKNIHKAGSGCN